MRRSWTPPLVYLVFLLALLAITVYMQYGYKADGLFSVAVSMQTQTESIVCWADEKGSCYVFLPSYADLSKAQIELHTGVSVQVDGRILKHGMPCDAFSLGIPYEMTYQVLGIERSCTLTFVQSGNMPTLFVDTASGRMDNVHRQKGNEEAAELRLYETDGRLSFAGRNETISGRGNNTWKVSPKKPYSLTLEREADLLDMGAAHRWILLANANDHSHARNAIIYDFADEAGLVYSPDYAWVELYLNGCYAGLYMLCERNEVHPQRVDLTDEAGFLVSLEINDRLLTQGYPHIITQAQQYLRIHHPKNADDAVLSALSESWQRVENAILAEDGIDPVSGLGWQQMIDLDSWVKKYLVEEVFANGDACYISQFFYCSGDNVIYAGPVWDYDRTMGLSSVWQLKHANAMIGNRLHVVDGYDTPWFHELYQKPEFYECMKALYAEVFVPLLEDLIDTKLSSYQALLDQPVRMDGIRWGYEADPAAEFAYMADYLQRRMAFLDCIWLKGEHYVTVRADMKTGAFYARYVIAPGESLDELPIPEDNEFQDFVGWYVADTNEPFDKTAPVYEDTAIYAKWVDNRSKRAGQVIKLIPLAVIAVLGVVVLAADIRRMRKRG